MLWGLASLLSLSFSTGQVTFDWRLTAARTSNGGLVKGKEASRYRETSENCYGAMVHCRWGSATPGSKTSRSLQMCYQTKGNLEYRFRDRFLLSIFMHYLISYRCPSLPWSWNSNMGGTTVWLHMASYPLPSKIINAMVWQGKETNRRIRQHGQVLNAIRHQTIMQYNAIQEYWQDCNTASSSLHEHKTMKSFHMNSIT